MTTIQDLPADVLRMIFNNVTYSKDLLQIQKVCRVWYSLAHLTLLEEISLNGFYKINQFTRSIASNPKPSYLKAVKSISADLTDNHPQFSESTFKELFFCFPNLESVEILGSATLNKVLQDELCENFLNSCPKLKSFEINTGLFVNQTQYCRALYKARKLVTHLDIGRFEQGVSQFGGMLTFISNFPRLRKTDCYITIDNFQQIVPVFKKWPNLNKFSILCTQDDDSEILQTASKEEEEELQERLSKINYLELCFSNGSCLNTIKFAKKYMTGITSFHVSCDLYKTQSSVEQRLFCDYAMDLFNSTNHARSSSIYVKMKLEVLQAYLPVIIHTLSTLEKQNVLKVGLSERQNTPANIAQIAVRKEKVASEHIINLWLSNELSLQDTATSLFNKNLQITDVDKLAVEISDRRNYKIKASVDMYDQIIRAVPSKKMSLDVPLSFVESASACNDTYSHVEKLIIRATAKAQFQTLLDRCSRAFPNLNRLEIYYFCGVWREHTSEFELDLNGYSIDSLIVDMTPACEKIKKSKGEFLVIKVTMLYDKVSWVYKVPLNFSAVSPIQEIELQEFTSGREYHQVHITITSVQRLKVYYDNGPYAKMEFLLPEISTKRILSSVVFDNAE